MTSNKFLMFALVLAIAGATTTSTLVVANHPVGARTNMAELQKQKVEERKTQIKERIETAKAKRATKLADMRLEQCEKREARVNSIFTKATERNTKHLAVFQKIEERVKAFYVSKGIAAEGYEQAAQNADDKEAAAVAAIEAAAETNFDCSTADGEKPGSAIKEAMDIRHTALKEYRTAIKDLILVVKKHNGQNRTGAEDSAETGASPEANTDATTDIESETGGQE